MNAPIRSITSFPGLSLLALIVFCLAFPSDGQQRETRLRVDVRLVLLNTLVNQPTGAPAAGLKSEDFRVFEDGQEQQVAVFAAGAMPVHVALVVDTSGSTRESLPELKKAARRFAEQFGPEDQLALYDLGPDVMRLAGFTTDRRSITRALGQLETIFNPRDLPQRRRRAPVLAEAKPPGGTMLYDSLELVAAEFPSEAQRRVILVFTDGLDNASERTLEDVSRTVLRGSTVIYAVMPQPPLPLSSPAPTPDRSRRSDSGFSKKKWTVILDLSEASNAVEPLMRGAALKFLDQLEPEARLWIFEYRDSLRLLTPAEAPARLDSNRAPVPLTPAEAQVALERGLFWSRTEETGERARTRLEADHMLVLTGLERGGIWKLFRDGTLDPSGAIVLVPERFPEAAEQELVMRTLVHEPGGPLKAAQLSRWLSDEKVAGKFRELVKDTGGAMMEVRRAQDLGDSYAQIAKLIQSSYTLGYYTKAPPGRHELRVEVPGREVRVQSRRVLVVEP